MCYVFVVVKIHLKHWGRGFVLFLTIPIVLLIRGGGARVQEPAGEGLPYCVWPLAGGGQPAGKGAARGSISSTLIADINRFLNKDWLKLLGTTSAKLRPFPYGTMFP